MGTLLLKNAVQLLTMDASDRVVRGGGLYAVDGVIEKVEESHRLPPSADQVIDARDHVVLPGLICGHHHLFQTLTRGWPSGQSVDLMGWLRAHGPLWSGLDGESVYVSARLTLAELLISGCTTVLDQQTCFPNDVTLDVVIEAARSMGVRIIAGRGGYSDEGAASDIIPEALREDEQSILADVERLLATYHDPEPYAWVQVAVAPTHLARVSPGFIREAAALARRHAAPLHTHLGETAEEEAAFVQAFGSRPLASVAAEGWIGEDVSFAHGIHFTAEEKAVLGASGTGIVHCPTSNMWLGSGIADVAGIRRAGAPVGLGVDGGASSGSSNMLLEVRMGMLLQRVLGERAMLPMTALRLATAEGARVLGRGDLGVLAPGMAADFIAVDLNRFELAGTQTDSIAGLVFCAVPSVDIAVVGGVLRVWERKVIGFDWTEAVHAHNRQAAMVARRADFTLD